MWAIGMILMQLLLGRDQYLKLVEQYRKESVKKLEHKRKIKT